ncbi:hypothetical protein D3C80_1634210 [compost metagenome]
MNSIRLGDDIERKIGPMYHYISRLGNVLLALIGSADLPFFDIGYRAAGLDIIKDHSGFILNFLHIE